MAERTGQVNPAPPLNRDEVALLALVIFQAWLGRQTVLESNSGVSVTAHLATAMAFLGLQVWVLARSGYPEQIDTVLLPGLKALGLDPRALAAHRPWPRSRRRQPPPRCGSRCPRRRRRA